MKEGRMWSFNKVSTRHTYSAHIIISDITETDDYDAITRGYKSRLQLPHLFLRY